MLRGNQYHTKLSLYVFQVYIIGVVGDGEQGDIAIDDVRVTKDTQNCKGNSIVLSQYQQQSKLNCIYH